MITHYPWKPIFSPELNLLKHPLEA